MNKINQGREAGRRPSQVEGKQEHRPGGDSGSGGWGVSSSSGLGKMQTGLERLAGPCGS